MEQERASKAMDKRTRPMNLRLSEAGVTTDRERFGSVPMLIYVAVFYLACAAIFLEIADRAPAVD